MAANLGATTYTSLTWTSGDTATEAKMDNMVANDQAYDSHAAQGLLLNNNYHFAGKETGGTNIGLIRMSSSDEIELGETDYHVKKWASFSDIVTAADGATVTFDLQDGNIHQVTLGGNRTLALSNEKVGQAFIIRLIQDATGSRDPTWFTTINWDGGEEPTESTDANAIDVFGFIVTASGIYDGFILGLGLS